MFVPRINTERQMAIWNGLPSWMGGQGSTSDTAAMDEHSDALVEQLKAQYKLAGQKMNQNDYGNLVTQSGLPLSNWQNIYPTTTVTTGVATTTLPQYYPTPVSQYPTGSIYSSTGYGYAMS